MEWYMPKYIKICFNAWLYVIINVSESNKHYIVNILYYECIKFGDVIWLEYVDFNWIRCMVKSVERLHALNQAAKIII